MPENNQFNNANQNEKHTYTNAFRSTNGKCEVPSALTVTYYDDRIKLEFAPELPDDKKTETRRYDYDNVVFTYLTRTKANELYDAYQEVIIPAIKNGLSAQVSVPIAQINQLQIDTDPDASGTPRPKIKLIKNIDVNTLTVADENVVSYEFNTGEYILGYNPKTGEFKERIVTYNEFKLFMHDLHEFVDATSNAYVHVDRNVNRYWKDSVTDKLIKIGSANGLDLSYRSRNTSSATTGSIFSSKPSEINTNGVTLNSLDQIDSELPFN